MKPGTSSQIHARMGWTKWQRPKSANFEASQRLPGDVLEASRSFIYCMGTAKEMAIYNDITWARA